jgi:predicted amidohydrolase
MTTPQDDEPQTLVAACVQFDVRRGDVAGNLARAEAGIADAAKNGARLCVLPEMWSTSFLPSYDAAQIAAAAAAETRIAELSKQHAMTILGSGPESRDGAIFNCATLYDCGETKGSYRKVHLFSANAEHRHHRGGDEPLVVDTSAGRIGVMIGYDLRFPDLARYYFRKGAEILIVPAQWPEARSQHWRTLLRARAIENILFVIGSNRTGHDVSLKSEEDLSFLGDGRIVDPTGEILAAGTGESGIVTAEMDLHTVRTMRRMMPVHRDERPSVYRKLWDETFDSIVQQSREGQPKK